MEPEEIGAGVTRLMATVGDAVGGVGQNRNQKAPAAVEEQSATTAEIARNVSEAASV